MKKERKLIFLFFWLIQIQQCFYNATLDFGRTVKFKQKIHSTITEILTIPEQWFASVSALEGLKKKVMFMD